MWLPEHMRRPRVFLSGAALVVAVCATVSVLPSRHIRIAAGPIGGSYYETAAAYRKILEREGYRVDIVPMQNTDEIGADIADGRHRLDIGFIGQKPAESDAEKLMSLGDIQLQPLFIFERRRLAGNRPIRSFSSLRGMKIVLPPARSLTSRTVASVFALSGIDGRNTRIDYLPIDEGIARLQRGEFDAGLFILGADSDLMAGLARNPDLVMVETTQLTAVTK